MLKRKLEYVREKIQKEDFDELLEVLEKGNRTRANGNPAAPMSVMACEPLVHDLLCRPHALKMWDPLGKKRLKSHSTNLLFRTFCFYNFGC